MADFKAVAFDIDGTLYGKTAYNLRMVRSGILHPRLAWLYNRARVLYRERQADTDTVPENRSGYLTRMGQLMGELDNSRHPEYWYVRQIEGKIYSSWEKSYRNVPPREGIRECFETLKAQGKRIALLSDFPVICKPEALGIADLVDISLSSEDIGYLKPDPRVFSTLQSALGVPAERTLYVGDSYAKDVLGAKGAGMSACLITSKRGIYPEADFVVHSLKMIPGMKL